MEKSLLILSEFILESLNQVLSCIYYFCGIFWFHFVKTNLGWFSERLGSFGFCLQLILCCCLVACSRYVTFLWLFCRLFTLGGLGTYIWFFDIFDLRLFWRFFLAICFLWHFLASLTDRRLFGDCWNTFFAIWTWLCHVLFHFILIIF